MADLVLKFGGTSVADVASIKIAAQHVIREAKAGHSVVVVVSAMAGETNKLLDLCHQICGNENLDEQDVVVSSGEQITSAIMALYLRTQGLKAQSLLGWQVPIITDKAHGKARIKSIEVKKIKDLLNSGTIVVVAGFQGINEFGRISTLGRGGSDLTAVALAATLETDQCDIYTDVDGIYITDPRIVKQTRKITLVSYEEMLEMASLGAKVLHSRSVEMAMKYNVNLQVRSTFETADKLKAFEKVGQGPGTFVVKEEQIMEKEIVSGITYKADESKITLVGVPDTPGNAALIFCAIAEHNVNVDMIVQGPSIREGKCNITFTVPSSDIQAVEKAIKNMQEVLTFDDVLTSSDITKISIIGIGMRTHSGVAATMFKAMADNGINIESISTSEIKTSIIIDKKYTELALRILHHAYKLEMTDT